MSRHLDSLKRLYRKLEVRYGKEDELVLELLREIETVTARNAKLQANALPALGTRSTHRAMSRDWQRSNMPGQGQLSA